MALIKKSKKKNKDKSSKFSRDDVKKMLTANDPFIVKEAYSSIRTNLLFTQKGEKCPIFVVTSPTANNGKSLNAINMAISFAQLGKKTLIIDSDLRNPTIHRMFGFSSQKGLSEILAGLTDEITVTKTEFDNLSILTAGKIPPNPSELLSSERMDNLLDFVKEHFDCVFIDTPPINIVTDCTVFAPKTTGYVIVVKSDVTEVADLKTAVSNISLIKGNILGFVLNDVYPTTGKGSYYKKYDYNYGGNE